MQFKINLISTNLSFVGDEGTFNQREYLQSILPGKTVKLFLALTQISVNQSAYGVGWRVISMSIERTGRNRGSKKVFTIH